jgi:site-specific DNA-methyltransferase (adenine-specific)
MRVEHIGNATLYLGDCMDVLPTLPKVDAVITDPPYSERTHAGHDGGSGPAIDGAARQGLGYGAMTADCIYTLASQYARLSAGWIVWMTDHTLAPAIAKALSDHGRYVFAPLPYFHAGRSVRLTGDGPSSWTDWIVCARTSAQVRWGTLPGGYVAGAGWNDKERMGGKPTLLMDALVGDYSRHGDTVLDSHMGAGTTGVAGARSGRKFIGIEIDADTFDIACRRIEQAQKQGALFKHEEPKAEQLTL